MSKWETFTDREIDILYTALSQYRRDLVKGIQNETHEVVEVMLTELISVDRKEN
jgi:hypothetical protein